VAATHNFYDRPNQGYNQQGGNYNQGENYNQGWQDKSNQGWRDNSNNGWRDNYNRGGRDNNGNQRWNNNNRKQNQNQPYRALHLRQSQGPQHNQQQVPQITYPTSSSSDEMLRSLAQGQQDMQATLNSTLNGLNATSQALATRIDSLPTSTNQPLSSSGIPSQPLPNPKGGINAITLRSGTTLTERNQEEPSPIEHTQIEDSVKVEDAEMEDAEEEDEVQDKVEEETALPRNGAPKDAEATSGAIPIPFPHLARKSKKQMELNPKMVEIFKKVEVTVPLFDVIQQVPKVSKGFMHTQR